MMMVGSGLALAGEHPRLLFPASMEAGVKQRIAEDRLAADLQQAILKRAEKVIQERPCQYLIPDGKRLLDQSRLALHHVMYCGWAWRTTGEPRFRDRVILELDAACALKDWNPSHFLDTAEMSTAVAIGYDWLYPALDAKQRKRYEDALLEKGLRVVGPIHGQTNWWMSPKNNWSQVCGTGMALAAEAVRERDPEFCEGLIEQGRKLIEGCKSFYLPDGAYPEGPGYWHYGTNYHVLLLAARESLGQDVEVAPVLRLSGDFLMHVVGPTRSPFNYADGNAKPAVPSPAQSWLAAHFKDAGQAAYVRSELENALKSGLGVGTGGESRFFPLHLLWLPQVPAGTSATPLSARFDGEQSFGFFRSAWKPDAAWLAIKGGTGAASHGHLDAGSFIYDVAGVRWFHDLGSDDYNMPGYFGGQRWEYLRLNNRSHNTLVIDGKLQGAPVKGCPVSDWKQEIPSSGVTFDLSTAYPQQAAKVTRNARFDQSDGSVVIRDEIDMPSGPVRWAVVTKAAIKIDGPIVILEEGGKRLVLQRGDQAGGKWEEYSLKPATEREQQNQGFRMIGFTAPAAPSLKLKVAWKID